MKFLWKKLLITNASAREDIQKIGSNIMRNYTVLFMDLVLGKMNFKYYLENFVVLGGLRFAEKLQDTVITKDLSVMLLLEQKNLRI